ncbi:unnamed protein product [Rhodiola kirilowii]
MAVFERFIRPITPTFVVSDARGNHRRVDLEARGGLEWKLGGAPASPYVGRGRSARNKFRM